MYILYVDSEEKNLPNNALSKYNVDNISTCTDTHAVEPAFHLALPAIILMIVSMSYAKEKPRIRYK
jgi:hypothetical protein